MGECGKNMCHAKLSGSALLIPRFFPTYTKEKVCQLFFSGDPEHKEQRTKEREREKDKKKRHSKLGKTFFFGLSSTAFHPQHLLILVIPF